MKNNKKYHRYIQYSSISKWENNKIFVEFAILHHILKKLRIQHFNISFNSKTAIGAEQTHPSNNAWYSDSDSSNSHGIEEPQMTQIISKTSSK